MLVPSMRHFVGCNPKQTRVGSFTCYHCTHRILHSTITSLNNWILFPRIRTNVLFKIFQKLQRVFLKLFPIININCGFIKKVQINTSVWCYNIVYIFWVRCPCKIVNVRRIKSPSQSFFVFWFCFFSITVTNLISIH